MALSALIVDETADRLRAGERVTFSYRGHVVQAEVVEDRGDIGVGGRQIVRVRFGEDASDIAEFEMPATELTRVAP